jgi:chorismate dehydratase
VEYARDWERYLLLPDLAISCDGPVRSVMLFSKRPAEESGGRRVLVSEQHDLGALLELLFEHVWRAPRVRAGRRRATRYRSAPTTSHDARLVIGDAALMLSDAGIRRPGPTEVSLRV